MMQRQVKKLNSIRQRLFYIKACLLALVVILGNIDTATASRCIAANDFGTGGIVYIDANPDKSMTGDNTKLIQKEPRGQQIAPWIDSGLSTTGIALKSHGGNDAVSILRGFVEGGWGPWGGGTAGGQLDRLRTCEQRDCNKQASMDQPCLEGGKIVNDDFINKKAPCALNSGYGLYGLIAIDSADGSSSDPNDKAYALKLPFDKFRTFHAIATKEGPNSTKYFEISKTEACTSSACITDKDSNGNEQVKGGRLYFKILDRYYGDNTGGYFVNIISGAYSKEGFIQEVVRIFDEQMQRISKVIYENIVKNTSFIGVTRAMLALYVAVTGLMFMMGTIKIQQHELVIRLFKIGLIATLISDQSFAFFNNNLFSFFKSASAEIANLIMKYTLYYDGSFDNPVYTLPENGYSVAVYDILVTMFLSSPIHIKVWSLLFYKWQCYLIPFIYVCFANILLGVLKSVMMYILSLIQIALLLCIAPIFIVMILFSITKELFDGWLKALISSSLLIVVITATISILMTLVMTQLQALLSFTVCWDSVWHLNIGDVSLIDLKFWFPYSDEEVLKTLTLVHFFALLFVCALFNALVDKIPGIVDMLSGASLMPMNGVFHSSVGGAGKAVDVLQGAKRIVLDKTIISTYKGVKRVTSKAVGAIKSAMRKKPKQNP